MDDCIAEGQRIVREARDEHLPLKTFVLVSGGNDSMVLLDFASRFLTDIEAVAHVNTGIGIPQTNEFVREQVPRFGFRLIEMTPPIPYDELVLTKWGGFPGPQAHRYTYQMLKERCVRALIRQFRTARGQRFLLLAGVRKAESARRMGMADAIRRVGGQVWTNPLLWWDDADMAEYRERYVVPQSEVAKHLHMSGECLCGAFAHPGELDEIAFFYPAVAARIRALEDEAERQGLAACKWGQRPPGSVPTEAGLMCSSCDYRQGVLLAEEAS